VPSSLNVSACIRKLREWKEHTTDEEGVEWVKVDGEARRLVGGRAADKCSLAELQGLVRAVLDRRPDINVNKLQQFLHLQSVHTCARLGRENPPGGFYHAVYTPPYECDTQPIELVWARVKRHVADRFSQTRTLEGIRDDVVEGLLRRGRRRRLPWRDAALLLQHHSPLLRPRPPARRGGAAPA
jgi:transposase